MTQPSFFERSPKDLVACLLGKQIVTKGATVAALLVTNAFRPQLLAKLDEWASLRPLLAYLRPSQIAVEAANISFDFVLLYVLKGKLPLNTGRFPSLAHVVLFSESCGQYFLPVKWRWALTYVVMDNATIDTILAGLTPAEKQALSTLQIVRWGFSWISCIVAKKATGCTPLKWKTIAAFWAHDVTLWGISHFFGLKAVARFPHFMTCTPGRYLSSTLAAMLTLQTCSVAASFFFHAYAGVYIQRLQQAEPLPSLEPELREPHHYREVSSLNSLQIQELPVALAGLIHDPSWDNNVRLHAVKHFSLVMDYIKLVNAGKISRVRTEPLDGNDVTLSSQDVTEDPQCMSCQASFAAGQRALRLSCGHTLCTTCKSKTDRDWCSRCDNVVVKMSPEAVEVSRQQLKEKCGQWLRAWIKDRYIPYHLRWSILFEIQYCGFFAKCCTVGIWCSSVRFWAF